MSELTARLNAFESRLRAMETELYELRRLARVEEAAPAPVPAPAPAPAPAPVRPPEPAAPVYAPPPKVREPLDLSVLLGARALAWTGGVVTLLGIVFFFVLAVDRGWIGPGMRTALGALASAAVFGAGLWLRRRYGDTYASVSAVGAGIAGSYATLLAATALYDLLPPVAALVVAAGIASAGAAVALAWNSETIAGLGLVGALLVPVPVAFEGGLTATGTAFALLVLVGTSVVAVRRDWRSLLTCAVAASAPQIAVLVFDDDRYALPLAIGFWLGYGGAATWLALRTRLSPLASSLLVFGAAFAGYSAALLFDEPARGWALLAVAVAYAAVSAAVFARERDTSSLLWAIALGVGAIAAADLLSGATLTIAWAAEASVLAWLARRLDEPRFQLASLGWLLLALVHGLGLDASPEKLFVANDEPWSGAPSAAALAAAFALVGLCAFEWKERAEGTFLQSALDDLRRAQPWLRRGALAAGALSAVYAASLVVVGVPSTWDWGHVAVAGLWSAVAVALVFTRFRLAALAATVASIALVVGYDLDDIGATERSWAFALVAAAALVVAIAYQLGSAAEELDVASIVGVAASVALASASAVQLLDGRAEGTALLALAAGYLAVGVAVLRRHRDLASALGVAGLVVAVPASRELLDGTWLVLAWATGAAALAVAARREERLEYAALAYLGLALGHALALEAPVDDVFVAQRHPGAGAPAIVAVLAAALVLARTTAFPRAYLGWAAGALALYAATLGILEGFEAIGGGVDAAFQRGHVATSALWGAVGLGLLYTGLTRKLNALLVGGFALFGISLAKLFFYDLPSLSSVTRALSFLAVGGLLLVAGFFYQRLNVDSRA